ncbi:MAG: glycosyltransferase family 1 protein [Phycisphaerales bacterium]|nr:glycosyltransferase family 1 protein [Phycisphaerales bacterium]
MPLLINARFLTQNITGVQRYALECSRKMKRMDNNIIFVSPHNIKHTAIAKELDVQIIGTHQGHLWEQLDLYKFAKKMGNPPLLNFANTAPLLYPNNYICIHDLAFQHKSNTHPFWFSLWYRFLVPKIAQRAKGLFTVSNTIKNQIEQSYHIEGNKISVTYNGIAEKLEKYSNNPVQKQKQILFVGSFDARKKFQLLIAAFIAGQFAASGYRLILIGHYLDKIKKTIELQEWIEQKKIEIIEAPNDSQLVRYYQESELFVSMSSYEGFNIPILEALYFNCKVLCSAIPTHVELYKGFVRLSKSETIQDLIGDIRLSLMDTAIDSNLLNVLVKDYSFEQSSQVILNAIQENKDY